jgi:predicted RNA binding protein YcfA (HicA-like mRNA interferase family)
LKFGQVCPILKGVRAGDFVKKIKRLGHKRGVAARFEAKRGKGSHGVLYFGSAFTIVQDMKREVKTGMLDGMLKQLGLTAKDLEE